MNKEAIKIGALSELIDSCLEQKNTKKALDKDFMDELLRGATLQI